MTTFHEADTRCPCCDAEVKVRVLTSPNTFGGQHTDFHSVAVGFPPLPIMMNTCPNCGFSGYERAFLEPVPLSAELRAHIERELTPQVRLAPPNGGKRYEFAARISQWQGAPALQTADLYLRAAWCCVDEGTPAEEIDYRLAAIDYFQQALANGDISPQHEPNITYLIGELYRRVGDEKPAQEWFNKVIERAESDPTWKGIAEAAAQQRDNPREMFGR
jgi:uncharacterized protein (DUF2225 family)